uniref:Uncharacterized protein n=1 Tax=Arundo donax TaxID=35708 RepID=A0A0A8XPA2_ARUDO
MRNILRHIWWIVVLRSKVYEIIVV